MLWLLRSSSCMDWGPPWFPLHSFSKQAEDGLRLEGDTAGTANERDISCHITSCSTTKWWRKKGFSKTDIAYSLDGHWSAGEFLLWLQYLYVFFFFIPLLTNLSDNLFTFTLWITWSCWGLMRQSSWAGCYHLAKISLPETPRWTWLISFNRFRITNVKASKKSQTPISTANVNTFIQITFL